MARDGQRDQHDARPKNEWGKNKQSCGTRQKHARALGMRTGGKDPRKA